MGAIVLVYFSMTLSKCIEGLVIFRFISFLSWIHIVKVLGVIHANWLKTRCTRDITKYFFLSKVINRWNLLYQRTVDAPSNTNKSRLCYIRDNRMSFFMD